MGVLNVDLTPEDIEALVKESIMKCGFGAAVTKAVTAAFTGYNNPIDEEVKRYVRSVAADLLSERFSAQIKESIAAHLESLVTKEMLDTVVSNCVTKMAENASRY